MGKTDPSQRGKPRPGRGRPGPGRGEIRPSGVEALQGQARPGRITMERGPATGEE